VPANAECIVQPDTCKPKVRIKKGAVCFDGDVCVDGTTCKPTNVSCPPGADCFAPTLNTCQK
jgi:hypothetical protein